MASAKRRLQRMRALIRTAKEKPCADCGVQYPYFVMDFDHRDPSQKVACINVLAWCSEQALREEIAKCDVVCANCHRMRTWGRGGDEQSLDEIEVTCDGTLL
jgi:hypothetical protein